MNQLTHIFLEKEDKERICKLAQINQLSISACIQIIAKHYCFMVINKKDYYKRGKIDTFIKIRKLPYEINTILVTNSIYAYLHQEVLKDYPNQNYIKKSNSQIQSELKKTYDINFMKNAVIRQTYAQMKARENKWH